MTPFQSRLAMPFVFVGIAGSMCRSMPRSFEVDRLTTGIGETINFQAWDADDELRSVLGNTEVLSEIARYNWWVEDPAVESVNTPFNLAFYSRRDSAFGPGDNYLVIEESEPQPAGLTKVHEQDGIVLYARDPSQVHNDRFQRRNTEYRRSIYDLPRKTLLENRGKRSSHQNMTPSSR